MSGRIYDNGINPTCKKCGSDMFTSLERNFNGPKCKNKKCDGGVLDAMYELYTYKNDVKIVYDKNDNIVLTGLFPKIK